MKRIGAIACATASSHVVAVRTVWPIRGQGQSVATARPQAGGEVRKLVTDEEDSESSVALIVLAQLVILGSLMILAEQVSAAEVAR